MVILNWCIYNLNKSEREVYETYKKELNELVELSRNRRPNKIIIVTDKRDVFTEDEINTKYHLYRIIKDENLTFSNIKQHLVQDPEFGSGVLYVILCGINSINREKINPACLKAQCTSPYKFLYNMYCEIDLIRKALYIHKMILKFNKEDTAIFSGLIPSLPNIFNKFSYKKKRKCSRIHKADLPPQCVEEYDINKLHLYNTFTKLHSKLLGFTPLNLERGFFVKNNNSDNPIVTFNFKKTLKNGYHFTDKFASNRKLAILNKCDKLMEKLSQSTYLEQDKEILNRLDGGPKSNIRIDYSSQSEEAAVTQVTLESKIESFLHEKKIMNYSSIPMTKELQYLNIVIHVIMLV
ncbi:hypothetical protein Avbf_18060 [Armadillidium vulgare]|nr:hypothetical protein Avbf_18060 [Armadillidium vulgare]